MTISRLEQETIIGFNEAEATASVYTHNGALKRKLEKLAKEEDDDVYKASRKAADVLIPQMDSCRALADSLETLVAKDAWPMPTYSDILFY